MKKTLARWLRRVAQRLDPQPEFMGWYMRSNTQLGDIEPHITTTGGMVLGNYEVLR